MAQSKSWCVYTGRPSWHQARAGHFASGAYCLKSKRDADKYARRYKKLHPGEPVFIRPELITPQHLDLINAIFAPSSKRK